MSIKTYNRIVAFSVFLMIASAIGYERGFETPSLIVAICTGVVCLVTYSLGIGTWLEEIKKSPDES